MIIVHHCDLTCWCRAATKYLTKEAEMKNLSSMSLSLNITALTTSGNIAAGECVCFKTPRPYYVQ